MTTHTPRRTSYSAMVTDFTNSNIALMDTGNFPGYSNYLNETYTFASGDWTATGSTLIDPAGPLPGRTQEAMAYDGYAVMLYGGHGEASGQIFEDVYTWSGTAWTKQSPANPPFGRFGAQATYLAGAGGNAVAVMFGGFGGAGNGQMLLETWIWNGSNHSWLNVTLANGLNPPARIGHVFAANTTDGYLFGGEGTNSQFNDMWAFTYTGSVAAWTKVTPIGTPSVRSGACMSWDSTNNLFVLFGGKNEYNYLDETYTYTPSTNTWAKVTIANGVGPSGRVGARMAWDTTSSKTIMFGGISATDSYASDQTWSFDGSLLTWSLV